MHTADDGLKALRERAVRLAAAAYRVSGLFPEDAPLGRRVRERADEIAGAAAGCGDARERRLTGVRIDAMMDLLSIADEMGWVHTVNIKVLLREYGMLGDLVREYGMKEVGFQKEDSVSGSDKEVGLPAGSPTSLPDDSAAVERFAGSRTSEDSRSPTSEYSGPGPVSGVNDRQRMILERLREREMVKISDFFETFGDISSKTIQRDLQDLVARDMIRKTGDKRWTVYMLSDKENSRYVSHIS